MYYALKKNIFLRTLFNVLNISEVIIYEKDLICWKKLDVEKKNSRLASTMVMMYSFYDTELLCWEKLTMDWDACANVKGAVFALSDKSCSYFLTSEYGKFLF